MKLIFAKIAAIFGSIIALLSPTPTPTPVVLDTPPPIVESVIETATPVAGETVTPTPTVIVPTPAPTTTPTIQEQIEELKEIIASYTPEPTPTPIVVYIPAPTPTPEPTPIFTPTPTPEVIIPIFTSIQLYTAQTQKTWGHTILQFTDQSYARCEYPCIKVKTATGAKVKITYVAKNVTAPDVVQTVNEFKEGIYLFDLNAAGLVSGTEYNFFIEAISASGGVRTTKLDLDGLVWKMP